MASNVTNVLTPTPKSSNQHEVNNTACGNQTLLEAYLQHRTIIRIVFKTDTKPSYAIRQNRLTVTANPCLFPASPPPTSKETIPNSRDLQKTSETRESSHMSE
jgi:hypothetical protein